MFYFSGFFILLLFLVIVIPNITDAQWVEPGSDPPHNNMPLPLNQSAMGQYKIGPLVIGSSTINPNYLFSVVEGNSLFSEAYISKALTVQDGAQIILSGTNSKVNLSNGSSINLSPGTSLIGKSDNTGSAISITHSGDSSHSGIYSYSPGGYAIDTRTDNGVAFFANSENGWSVFAQTNKGVALYGKSDDNLGVAGRFDGKVVFNNLSGTELANIKSGYLTSKGITTVYPQAFYQVGDDNVYQENTVVTSRLCFASTTADGLHNPAQPMDCRYEFGTAPYAETWYIWSSNNPSLPTGAYQPASMSLDGLISVKCNDDGVQTNPSKGIKIGEGSYIYDSSCDSGGGGGGGGSEIPFSETLHIQSQEAIKIASTKYIDLKINQGSGNEKGMRIMSTGDIGIGRDINMNNDKSIAVNHNNNSKIYIGNYSDGLGFDFGTSTHGNNLTASLSVEGSVAANALCMGDDCRSSWGQVASNLWTSSSDNNNIYPTNLNANVGIGTTTPQAQLHVNGGIYLTPTTTQFAKNILFNNSNGDLVWRGGIMLVGGDLGPNLHLVYETWQNSNVAPWEWGYNSINEEHIYGKGNPNGNANFNVSTHPGKKIYNFAFNTAYLEAGTNYIISFNAQSTSSDANYFGFVYNINTSINSDGNSLSVLIMKKIKNLENYLHFIPESTGIHNLAFFSFVKDGEITINNFSIRKQDSPGNISVSGLYTGIGGSEGIKVDPFGNVGIGTSVPAAELHVDGDVIISGSLCVGGLCVNDLRSQLQCPPKIVPVIISDGVSPSFGYLSYEDCDNETHIDRVRIEKPQICDSSYACKYLAGADHMHTAYDPCVSCEAFCKVLGLKTRDTTYFYENIDYTDDYNQYGDIFYCDTYQCYFPIGIIGGNILWGPQSSSGYTGRITRLMSCTCYK